MSAVLFVVYLPVEEDDEEENNVEESIDKTEDDSTPNCKPADPPRKLSLAEEPSKSPRDISENAPLITPESPEKSKDNITPISRSDEVSISITGEEERDKTDNSLNGKGVPKLNLEPLDDESKGTNSVAKSFMKVEDEDIADYESHRYTLAEAVQNILEDLNIEQDTWNLSDDGTYTQVTFVVAGSQVDTTLKRLTNCGIGHVVDTSVSLFPASYHSVGSEIITEDSNLGTLSKKIAEKEEFVKSIKSRLTVAQVVDAVQNNAKLTFDYIALVVLASIIAGLGLAENSSVILVASMLVSPLMGPIMGGTFGIAVGYQQLRKLGVKNEVIGLSICLVCGLLLGFLIGGVNCNGAIWGSSSQWPTEEMQGRGLLRGLWVGILIAIPSGAGVALSIVGGNTGSLVGVAISASLLPPAVNAGMLWAYAIIAAIHPPPTVPPPPAILSALTENSTTDANITTTTSSFQEYISPALNPPHCSELLDNTFKFTYSCSMASEVAILGAVSLLLTLLNIACIFVMGVLVLRIKEIIPETALSESKAFWRTDIKVARKNYQTIKSTSGKTDDQNLAAIARQIAEEFKTTHDGKQDPEIVRQSWNGLLREMENDKEMSWAVQSMPNGGNTRLTTFLDLEEEGERAIQQMFPEHDVGDHHYFTVCPAGAHVSWHSSTGDSVSIGVRHRHSSMKATPEKEKPKTAPIQNPDDKPFTFDDVVKRSHKRRQKGHRQNRGLSRSHSIIEGPQHKELVHSKSGRTFEVTPSRNNSMTGSTTNAKKSAGVRFKDD